MFFFTTCYPTFPSLIRHVRNIDIVVVIIVFEVHLTCFIDCARSIVALALRHVWKVDETRFKGSRHSFQVSSLSNDRDVFGSKSDVQLEALYPLASSHRLLDLYPHCNGQGRQRGNEASGGRIHCSFNISISTTASTNSADSGAVIFRHQLR